MGDVQVVGTAEIPEGYEVWKDGVFLRLDGILPVPPPSPSEKVPQGRWKNLQQLSPRSIWVSGLGKIRDTSEPLVRLSYAAMNGESTHVWVDQGQVFDRRLLLQLSGAGLPINSDNAKELCTFLTAAAERNAIALPIADVAHRAGRYETDGKTGWLLGERWVGLPPAVQADPRPGHSVAKTFGCVGEWEEWRAMWKRLGEESWACRLLVGATFVAPLLHFLNLRTFILDHWGTTGTGKTSLAVFAQSAWGNPKISPLYASMNMTEISATEVFHHISEIPVLYNEKQVASIDPSRLIYAVCEMTPRQRGQKVGGLRLHQPNWRTLVRTTGEASLVPASDLGGQTNRVLEFNEPAHWNQELLEHLYEFTDQHHGHAGWRYLQKLREIVDDPEQRQTLRAAYRNLRLELTEATGRRGNHVAYAAAIALAQMTSERWLLEIESNDALLAAKDCAIKLILKNVPEKEVPFHEKAINWLRAFVHTNNLMLDCRDLSDAQVGARRAMMGQVFGTIHHDATRFVPERIDPVLAKAGMDPRKVWRLFAEQGWLNRYTNDYHLTIKASWFNGRQNVYSIKNSVFQDEGLHSAPAILEDEAGSQ